MKWTVRLHGGENHGKETVFKAEDADHARRIVVRELRDNNAMVFELEKLD